MDDSLCAGVATCNMNCDPSVLAWLWVWVWVCAHGCPQPFPTALFSRRLFGSILGCCSALFPISMVLGLGTLPLNTLTLSGNWITGLRLNKQRSWHENMQWGTLPYARASIPRVCHPSAQKQSSTLRNWELLGQLGWSKQSTHHNYRHTYATKLLIVYHSSQSNSSML